MIPPHGEERMEVHAHWEEILLNKLKDIRFPSIRILNMAQVPRTFYPIFLIVFQFPFPVPGFFGGRIRTQLFILSRALIGPR